MICSKCQSDILDARLGGLCFKCEELEKEKRRAAERNKDIVLMGFFFIVVIGALLFSAAFGVLKFMALIKWIRL
jgi:hypothetical protein